MGPSYFGRQCIVRDSIVGRFAAFGDYCRLVRTEIGGFCSIGDNVLFNAGVHPTDWLSTHLFQMHPSAWAWCDEGRELTPTDTNFTWRGRCRIGHDVWIGANACIKTGVTVGNGAIVGEGAFVTTDVPDFAVVAGKPAEIKKYRFSSQTIERIQRIQWWDLPLERLRNLPYYDINKALDMLEKPLKR